MMAFFLAGTGSLVFGQRYNPYNPYNPYTAPEHRPAMERFSHESTYYSNSYGALGPQTDPRYYYYERDYLTRPYVQEYRKGIYQDDYLYNPYRTIPRKWYDTQLGTTGEGSGRGFEVPGMLSSPYEDTYLRQKQSEGDQGDFRQRYSSDSDYTTIPYGSDPRRWYDTPAATAQGTSPRALEPPRTFASPYSVKEVPPLSSQVLTSPYEKGGFQYYPPGQMGTTQELTPPMLPQER